MSQELFSCEAIMQTFVSVSVSLSVLQYHSILSKLPWNADSLETRVMPSNSLQKEMASDYPSNKNINKL
jgi:hypothetical protein